MEVAKDAVVPKDVAFLIDVSGSMEGPKLEQAKKALDFCVGSLRSDDRFTIISFSDETQALFDKLEAAGSENVRKAHTFIEKLSASGGTDIHSALVKAVTSAPGDERPCFIVLLTDGEPTVGETSVGRIVDAVKRDGVRRVRVFSFGVGYDVNQNSSTNWHGKRTP